MPEFELTHSDLQHHLQEPHHHCHRLWRGLVFPGELHHQPYDGLVRSHGRLIARRRFGRYHGRIDGRGRYQVGRIASGISVDVCELIAPSIVRNERALTTLLRQGNCFVSAAFVLSMRKRIKVTGFTDWETLRYNNLLSIPPLVIFSLILEDWSYESLIRNL